ncbi:uncharacterized protein UBRO_20136 [Ustilago bromivora]|uniref:Uncharacterized protein n=1 Tax=Ustilago bromivora TaxID=307758 RepID=A0A1K0GZ80_9BASI|nr:uncharacterized protein UBRO_20136 [Ustilago bromivora]
MMCRWMCICLLLLLNFTTSSHWCAMSFIDKSYQHAILPSHCDKANKPANKLHKDMVYCDLSRSLFPTRSVYPSCIKFKVWWLQGTYHWEKKALLLTGAGTLLKGMDATNPSYMSKVALSAKYPWFEKMHKMMKEHVLAGPAILLTTPSLDVAGNEDVRDRGIG